MRHHQTALKVLLLGFTICTACIAGPIIYDGSFSTANNTATYSITTDGALGTLTGFDIISITVSDTGTLAFGPYVISGTPVPNPNTQVVGTDLTATATQLLFNFGDTNVGEFYFRAGPFVSFNTAGNPSPFGDAKQIYDGFSEFLYAPASSVIASAQTPEPGTLATTLGGVLLGLAAWKRRRQPRQS